MKNATSVHACHGGLGWDRIKPQLIGSYDMGSTNLVDIEEAAERLRVTPRFMRRLVAERRIPFFKIGKYVRFDVADLEQWIAERRVESVTYR
jgi:excisionase family DNA binding protein